MLIAFSLGSLIGLVLGLTGAGGGVLAVPALVLGLGWSMTQSSTIALVAVGSAAFVGMVRGFKQGFVRVRAALLISVVGILAAPFGQGLAQVLPERWLVLIFSAVMLIVAVRMFRAALRNQNGREEDGFFQEKKHLINKHTGRIVWNASSFLMLSVIGFVSGITTGMLGVGGGFIIVPALMRFSNISMSGIVATTLMVITLVSGGALMSAHAKGIVDFTDEALIFISGAVMGMLLAGQFARRIPAKYLHQVLALVMLLIATVFVIKELD
jgi:hypothetical protein